MCPIETQLQAITLYALQAPNFVLISSEQKKKEVTLVVLFRKFL